MARYIATFHTHHAALRSVAALRQAGVTCRLAPVPRYLSTSCGTCVRYEAGSPHLDKLHEDMEQVVELGIEPAHTVLVKNL